jgi:uncharacterized protein YdhG (YjbR/CyaY superfamily)
VQSPRLRRLHCQDTSAVDPRWKFQYHSNVKKGNDADRRTARSKKTPKSVDEYFAGVPEHARSTLNKLRAAIRSAVPPDAVETISYQIPAFKHKGVLVWYAAFSDHCSLFPTASIIEAFKNDLVPFRTSKGTIRFPTDKPLPIALIKKLVKARVAQIESKKTSRARQVS